MRMRVVEVSGRTTEEAVDRALEQLGLRRDQVDVDVIREGKRGVFGIGGEDAIVRVSARESGPASALSEDRPARRGDSRSASRRDDDDDDDDDEDDDDAPPTRGAVPTESTPSAGAARSGQRAPSGRGGGGRPGGGRGEGRDNRGGRGGSGGGYGGARGEGYGGGGGGFRGEGPRGRLVGPDEEVKVPGAPADPPVSPIEESEDAVDMAGHTLRDILTLLGMTETEIAARDPETPGDGLGLVAQVLEVYGNDEDASDELGLLIGRRGDTLTALQYLLNVLVSSKYGNDQVFGVDIEQYRRRREQALVEMAKRIAAEVRESGDVITLEPMPAAERRIIHITLEAEAGVRTESVGSGTDRQVEVMPAE